MLANILKPTTLKLRLLIWTVFLSTVSSAQAILIDSCGLNTDSKLSKYESAYFNGQLSKQRGNFDFVDKKVGFAYGNFGKTVVSKKEYFDRWGRDYFKRDSHVVDILLILTADEKVKSGDFDAIIVSWSKIMIDNKHRQKIISKLKR